ncbi:MAG: VWA domain-containing protein [Planctomycetes bacterium]|nr:VWA domain-containing protein [Planctomycetota bacterium]
MTGLEFDDLRWLHLLWVVLAVAAVGVYGIWQRRRAVRLFAAARLLPRLGPPVGWARPLLRLLTIMLGLVALVAACIGPRWGEVEMQVIRRNIDVMVLLDVSRSMLARDIVPNRLERAKLSIRDDLLPALGGDRVGLITLAGVATLKCPLTTDYGFFRLVLEEISTASSPRGGTLIGDGIRRAGECFSDDLDTHKVVILITDGEDHDSFPVEAARGLWEDHAIPIVAVAFGDEREGARIPIATDGGERYLEHKGQTIWSKANFDDLRRIAGVSDLNAFVPVGTRDFDLGAVYREKIVPALEYKERVESERVRQPARYHVFAAAALILLVIESFPRPSRRPERRGPEALSDTRGAAA